MTRKMKTLWLAAAVALAIPSMTALAEPGGGMGGMGGGYGHPMGGMRGCHNQMGRMADRLGLTDAQQNQIDDLHDQTRKDMRPLWRQKRDIMRKMQALNPEDKNYVSEVKKLAKTQGELTEKMTIIMAQSRAKFYTILTDAQKAKLKQMREQRRKAYMGRRDRGMGGGGPGGMGNGPGRMGGM